MYERVAVLGAGAVGASLVAMMRDADRPVTLLADAGRADRLRSEGLTVNGRHYEVPVDAACDVPYDLILVATKWTHLKAALPLIVRAAGPHGRVMSLLNGIRSEEVIGRAGVAGRVIPAMILGIDAMRDGAEVTYLNRGTISFGSDARNAPVPQSVLDETGATLLGAGIPCRQVPDILRTLWWKFMINVGINQCSAVLGAPYGLFQRSAHARSLMDDAMREVLELSRAESIGLTEADLDAWHGTLRSLNPSGKTSMLQDVEAGRPTEVDLFAGTVLQIAEQHAIDVPVNRTLYRVIRALEERSLAGG